MTPKTQSVCKHCGQKLVRRPSGPSAPPLGTISSGYARYCDEVLQLPPETIPAPQTSAEPPELSDRAKVALYPEMRDELNRLRSENSSLRAYRLNAEFDAQLSAPQPVSGDAPNMNDPRYCGACKHVHPPHEVDCRCYCDKVSCPRCGPRIAARVMTGDMAGELYMTCTECGMNVCDHIVKRLAGDAPKVEETRSQLLAVTAKVARGVYMPDIDNCRNIREARAVIERADALRIGLLHELNKVLEQLTLLRPYFPPASQSPPVDAFPEWWLKEWDDALASAQEYERDAANANPESGYAPQQTMTDEEIQVAQEATSTANVRRMIAEIRRLRVATPASTAREQKDKNDN